MMKIKLTQNKYALVDDVYFEKLNKYKWFAAKNGRTFYAKRNSIKKDGKRHSIWMHRSIMGLPPKSKEIDHKDGNGLNNQINNLRFVTLSQNRLNARIRSDNTSGYKGVGFHKACQKWVARGKLNGKDIHIGLFKNKNEAIEAVTKFADEHYKEFKKLK